MLILCNPFYRYVIQVPGIFSEKHNLSLYFTIRALHYQQIYPLTC